MPNILLFIINYMVTKTDVSKNDWFVVEYNDIITASYKRLRFKKSSSSSTHNLKLHILPS